MSAHALLFGQSASPLHGVYHAPMGVARDRAVLVCPPFLHENVRAHRVLRQLAQRLARAGHPVLRFDPHGEGDSSGDDGAGDVERWVDDVRTAAEELLDNSGARRLAIVGVRLGASVAALAAARGLSVDRLVLWDPVLDGARHLRALDGMHAAMLRDPARFSAPRHGGAHELLGHCFPQPRRASIAAVDLCVAAAKLRARKVTVIASSANSASDDAAASGFCAALAAAGVAAQRQRVSALPAWDDLARLEETILPGEPLLAALATAVEAA